MPRYTICKEHTTWELTADSMEDCKAKVLDIYGISIYENNEGEEAKQYKLNLGGQNA